MGWNAEAAELLNLLRRPNDCRISCLRAPATRAVVVAACNQAVDCLGGLGWGEDTEHVHPTGDSELDAREEDYVAHAGVLATQIVERETRLVDSLMGVVICDYNTVNTGIHVCLDPLSKGGLSRVAVMPLIAPVVLRGRRVCMNIEPPPLRTRSPRHRVVGRQILGDKFVRSSHASVMARSGSPVCGTMISEVVGTSLRVGRLARPRC